MKEILLNGISLEEFRKIISEEINKTIESQINYKSSDDKKLLTRKEVANILKISLPTLDEWTKKGFIKAHRIGNRKRYIMDEVCESLKEVKVYKYRRDVN